MITLDVKKTLPWITFLIFFAVMNETVFNVSIPGIMKEFSLTETGVSWVMTAFIVFFGVGSVVFGKLSDLFSLKRLISIGIVTYAFGSLLGFVFQSNYAVVLTARAIQGIGGSAIPALIMVIVARYFAPEVRGALFGSIGSVISIALGIGPVIGGQVSQHFHWAWLFLLPLPVLVALPFLNKLLPEEEHRPGNVDILGAALMVLGLGSLIIWLTYPEWPWLTVGAVLMVLFLVRIFLAKEPFIQPSLFKNAPFSRGVITSLFVFGVVIGIFFIFPILFTKLHGLPMDQISYILFPGAISGVVFGPIAGRLADRRGNRLVLFLGLGLLVASLGAAALLITQSPWWLAGTLLFTYIGFTFLQTGLINSVSQTLGMEETGVGMGMFNLVGILAGAVGTAVVAKVLEAHWLDFMGILLVFAALAGVAGLWYAFKLPKGAVGGGSSHGH